MSIINKRPLNLVLVLTLLLSLILPSVSVGAVSHQDTGSLTIHKFEREPGATAEGENQTGPSAGVPSDAKPLAGVEYEVIQTHSFDGKDWNEVTDGEVRKVETGDTGIVKVDNLLVGRYTVQEISGPADIILNDEKFSVDIPMTYNGGKDLAYDVNIYPKNEKIRGAVELTKINEAGEILPGAQFELYNEAGTKVGEDLTTNNNGKVNAENLAAGNYYFQEKSTVGNHALNNSKVNFTVKKNQDGKEGKTEIVWETIDGFTKVDSNNPNNIMVTNYLQPNIEKYVEGDTTYFDRDQEFKYNIAITSPGDIKKYSKIAVTDTLDERLQFITNGSITDGWEVTGTTKDNVTLTHTGQKLEWKVKDLTKLTPNTDVKITFTAKIKSDANLSEGESGIPNKANLIFDNNRGQESEKDSTIIVTPRDGGMKVLKVDKNGGATLAGAEFKLTTDEAGNNIVDAKDTIIKVNNIATFSGKLENLSTNSGGEILITGLTPGNYYLHETKAPIYIADDGTNKSYRLLTKPERVEIIDNVDNKEVIVENSKSGWLLPTTGGLGTILFTVIGLALMAIALFAYLRRRKTAEQ